MASVKSRNAGGYHFKLLFSHRQIANLAERYDFPEDTRALEAGKKIRAGQYTRANLQTIFEWKTRGRGRSRLLKNSKTEIADALRLAVAAKTERAAIAVLLGMNGIQIPVASAILTAINPARYTIIDVRALEALDSKDAHVTINFYLAYLNECRRLAAVNGVTLRNLDRALWQWSKEKSKRQLNGP